MADEISREKAVRAALQRVLESRYFAQAGGLSNLLRYVVEETLAGRGAAIKELTLGDEVFSRGSSFDPKTDGIVRVQASRMRSKLRDYYAAEGRDDEILISVPAGAYAAVFLPNARLIEEVPVKEAPLEGAPAEEASKDAPIQEAPAPPGIPRWVPWASTAILLAVTVVLLGSMWKSGPSQIESVAVLPFRNLTGDASQDYLADGLTDALITDLGGVSGLQVLSRTTSMSLAGTKKSLSAVARELKVDALVEGSMTRVAGNIRVNVNLVDVRDGERNLWSGRLEHGDRDFAGLQDAMNRQVAEHIKPGAQVTPRGRKSPNPDAHAAYLKGRHVALQGTEAGLRNALDWYGKATALDPEMASAKSTLAHTYVLLSDFFMSPAEALPLAKIAASDAIRIDPSLADAYAARGATALFNDRDAQAAETNLRQALKLNPSSAEANSMFAVLCGSMGRFDEAVAYARRAVQLDPLSPNAHVWLQWILLIAERYQEVEQVGHAALELFPGAPLTQLWIGASHALRGDYQKAGPFFENASKFDQIPMVPLFLGLMKALKNDRPGALTQLAKAHKIGQRRYICAYEVASLHSALGEMDEAYEWMERGLGERCVCITWLMTEPWMKSFRADPRFPALAAKIGLWAKARSF